MKTEQIKEILEGAPEDATHVDDAGTYYSYIKASKSGVWLKFTKHNTSFMLSQRVCIMRPTSLSDLREILSLREENEQLKARVSELENQLLDAETRNNQNSAIY